MPEKKVVLKFEMRNWEQGYWLTVEVPYTKHNWDWVMAHPNTANIRKVYKSA